MIFITVGTHEQPFNRLVEYMDKWALSHDEEVIIQTGYTKYEPSNCKWQNFYKQDVMDELTRRSRIIITHGGPSCYIESINFGKFPIVVPRRREFGEHIDDHQLLIGREFKERYGNIILIEDIEKLGGVIEQYDSIVSGLQDKRFVSHSREFCDSLSNIIGQLFS